MNCVGIVYDELNSTVEVQIVRDLLVLGGQWDIAVNDLGGKVDPKLFSEMGIPQVTSPIELCIVYKFGKDWPEHPEGVETVERDLHVSDVEVGLDPEVKIGYYLKPQGRDGANLTERYLNRSYPRGRGIIDPLVTMMWG